MSIERRERHDRYDTDFHLGCPSCEGKEMTMTTPLNVMQEYEYAAESLAKKGLKGLPGDPLPNLMSVEAVDLINADPEAFQMRVREHAYAIAMNKLNIPEV